MAESTKCRRCLLRDVSPEDYRKYVENLLRTIPPRDRTPEGVYTARLDACRACDQLLGCEFPREQHPEAEAQAEGRQYRGKFCLGQVNPLLSR